MTPIALAWTIAAALWAGVLALAGIWLLNRWLRRPAAREPESEPPSTAAAARPWRLLRMVRRLVERDRPVPHEGEPHTGADERFRDELRALRDLPPAPELVTDVETDLRWGQIWHDFERDLHVQIDDVFAPLLSALTEPLDAKTCMELDAVLAATG